MNNNNNIFDDTEHLRQVIRVFSPNVFTSGKMSSTMIEFIVTDFMMAFHMVADSPCAPFIRNIPDSNMENLSTFQKETYDKFWDIYCEDYIDNTILDPSSNKLHTIANGGYGVIKDTPALQADLRVIKYIKNEKELIFPYQNCSFNNIAWMVEFCTYVITMSVLMYIDCNFIDDDAFRQKCFDSRYANIFQVHEETKTIISSDQEIPGISSYTSISRKNGLVKKYFANYRSFMSSIDRPFAKGYGRIDRANGKYRFYAIGYILHKYENTIGNAYHDIAENKGQLTDDEVTGLTIQLVTILKKLNELTKLGINISHRDLGTGNTMFTKEAHPTIRNKYIYRIRLIDFGFLCIKIQFKREQYVSVGYHPAAEPTNNLMECNKKYADIVFFLLYLLSYHKNYIGVLQTNMDQNFPNRLINIKNFLKKSAGLKDFELNILRKKQVNDVAPIKFPNPDTGEYDGTGEKYVSDASIGQFPQPWRYSIEFDDLVRMKYNDDLSKIIDDNVFDSLIEMFENTLTNDEFKVFDSGNIPLYKLESENQLARFIDSYNIHKNAYLELQQIEHDENKFDLPFAGQTSESKRVVFGPEPRPAFATISEPHVNIVEQQQVIRDPLTSQSALFNSPPPSYVPPFQPIVSPIVLPTTIIENEVPSATPQAYFASVPGQQVEYDIEELVRRPSEIRVALPPSRTSDRQIQRQIRESSIPRSLESSRNLVPSPVPASSRISVTSRVPATSRVSATSRVPAALRAPILRQNTKREDEPQTSRMQSNNRLRTQQYNENKNDLKQEISKNNEPLQYGHSPSKYDRSLRNNEPLQHGRPPSKYDRLSRNDEPLQYERPPSKYDRLSRKNEEPQYGRPPLKYNRSLRNNEPLQYGRPPLKYNRSSRNNEPQYESSGASTSRYRQQRDDNTYVE